MWVPEPEAVRCGGGQGGMEGVRCWAERPEGGGGGCAVRYGVGRWCCVGCRAGGCGQSRRARGPTGLPSYPQGRHRPHGSPFSLQLPSSPVVPPLPHRAPIHPSNRAALSVGSAPLPTPPHEGFNQPAAEAPPVLHSDPPPPPAAVGHEQDPDPRPALQPRPPHPHPTASGASVLLLQPKAVLPAPPGGPRLLPQAHPRGPQRSLQAVQLHLSQEWEALPQRCPQTREEGRVSEGCAAQWVWGWLDAAKGL